MTLPIETERLLIRPSVPSDAVALSTGRSSDFVTRYNLYRPCDEEEYFSELSSAEECCREYFSVLDRSGGEPFGSVVLSEDSHRYHVDAVSVEAWLTEDRAGQGYMTEALSVILRLLFTERRRDRVSCEIMAENVASIRMVEKLGFVREGVLRGAVRTYDGIVHDSVLFSLTREEYLTGRAE